MGDRENGFLTPRSFLIGLSFSALCALMDQYSTNVIHGSSLAIDHMAVAAIFLFFVLLLVLQLLMKLLKKLQFSSAELAGIYIMAFVGCTVSTMGLGCYFLPTIAAPKYYADAQNNWEKLLLPHIKSWLLPQDKTAVVGYFEGIPKTQAIPWQVWLIPLFSWTPFLLALYLVMICFPILMRKQWVEKERILFPLAQVPLEMARQEKRSFLFFRNKLMWLGFAIPFVIGCLIALHNYFPVFPAIKLVNTIKIFRRTQVLYFYLSFPVMGFIFLTSTEISFSLWFFALLTIVLGGWFNIAGISSTENMAVYGSPSPIFNHLGTGALVVFVFYVLWIARFHLKEVFTKTFQGIPEDNGNEILPFKTCLFTLVISFLVMLVWLTLSGLNPFLSFFFLVLAIMIFMGITRVVIEGGVPTLIAPGIAPAQLVSSFGTRWFNPSSLASLAFTFVYAADIRTFVMSAASNSLKIAEAIKRKRNLVFWAMLLSVVINIITALTINLHLGYRYGAINLNSWYFVAGPKVAFDFAKENILHPHGPNIDGWWCKIAGGGLMAILLFLRARFIWWKLHPIGWMVGSCLWIQILWFSIFISWLLKTVSLKYGGIKLYNNLKPFFLGLALGQYVVAGLWFIIDLFTGMQGNSLFWI